MTQLRCSGCGKTFTDVELFRSHVHRMTWWQRFKLRYLSGWVAKEPENTIYGAFDDYYDGLITYDTYRERAERAIRAAEEGKRIYVHDDGTVSDIPCDDCGREDGTHDPEVEH